MASAASSKADLRAAAASHALTAASNAAMVEAAGMGEMGHMSHMSMRDGQGGSMFGGGGGSMSYGDEQSIRNMAQVRTK